MPKLGPKLPVGIGDAPLPPLSSTPRIFGESLPDPDFLPLCSPVVGQYLHSSVFSLPGSSSVGKDRDTVCTQFITQIFMSTAASAPGLTTTALEHGFPLVGTGKHLLFYSPSRHRQSCASATAQCAPVTKCHKHRTQPRVSVTPREPPRSPPCHTVQSQHGALCYPAPAVQELFKGTEAEFGHADF